MSSAHASLTDAPTHRSPLHPRSADRNEPLSCSCRLLRLWHSSAAIPVRRHAAARGGEEGSNERGPSIVW
jgi:hypothetical protein